MKAYGWGDGKLVFEVELENIEPDEFEKLREIYGSYRRAAEEIVKTIITKRLGYNVPPRALRVRCQVDVRETYYVASCRGSIAIDGEIVVEEDELDEIIKELSKHF